MTTINTRSNGHVTDRAGVGMRCGLAMVAVAAVISTLVGCEKPPPLEEVRVEPFEAYDIQVDESASPEDVAYVLVRALHDQVVAAHKGDRSGLLEARNLQRRLAAPDRIVDDVGKAARVDIRKVHLTPTKAVDLMSGFWGPISAYYVETFDLSREAAKERMTEVDRGEGDKLVLVNVAAPSDDERLLQVELTQEKGMWRVYKVGYGQRVDVRLRVGDTLNVAPTVTTSAPS